MSSKADASGAGKRGANNSEETERGHTNTGTGRGAQRLKAPWEMQTRGLGRKNWNISLSLAFELAPNAVTFSFLAALKTEGRKCRL